MDTSSISGSERNPVEALAEQFLERQRRGEQPSLDEYCRLYPELADEIRDLFPILIRMEDLGADSSGDSANDNAAIPGNSRLERLGDFRILREVGRGGMGVVYEAEQESLGRRVALKVLPDSALADPKHVLRFQREAKAAARLHHTNVVPVFGVGHEAGRYYYVMQFIPGMGLDAVLDELRRLRRSAAAAPAISQGRDSATAVADAILTGRFALNEREDKATGHAPTVAVTSPDHAPGGAALSSVSLSGASGTSLTRSDPDRTFFRSVANIGRQVAEALEYANRQGILHRDVKPSNLLLDPKGNVWVADFGLAKATDTDDLTHTGDIIGTLRYMAPERFAGKCDARSDVYALGLTLYELLSLRPAFEATDRHTMIRRVMNEEPVRLRILAPQLPRDLCTIVEKAIARDPSQRYATAALLAEDLQRYLDDKPIRARRVSSTEQAWRWARRNPAVASLGAGLLVTMGVGLITVTLAWRDAAASLLLAEAANRKAEARSNLAMQAIQAFTTGASEDVLLREKQLTGLRNKLLEGSLAFYDRLADLLKDETARPSRTSLAQAVYDAGELNRRIGRSEKALEAHRKALAIREVLAKEVPTDVNSRRNVARSELAVGETLAAMGRLVEARLAFTRARSIAEALTSETPGDRATRALLGDGFLAEGMSLYDEWRLGDERPFLVKALEIYDQLVRESSTNGLEDVPEAYLRGRARCSYRLGQWSKEYGPSAEGLAAIQQAIADYEALVRRSPGDLDHWLDLANSHLVIASYYFNYADRGLAKAGRHSRRTKAICERLASLYPTITSIRATWADVLCSGANSAGFDATRNEKQEKFRDREHSLALSRELMASAPENPKHVMNLSNSLLDFGDYLVKVGRVNEGVALQREAYDLLDNNQLDQSSLSLRREHVFAMLNLAITLALTGQPQEALVVLRKGIAREDAYPGPRESRTLSRELTRGYMLASYLEFGAGLRAEAAASAERAAAILDSLKDPSPQDLWNMAALAVLRFMQGRPAGPGRPAEPPGRPEYAARAIALLRQHASRTPADSVNVTAFFSPVMGHLPEFQRLIMDLPFPVDPFMPLPESPDDGPLPPALGVPL
jgi:serine/threonine protein kinase